MGSITPTHNGGFGPFPESKPFSHGRRLLPQVLDGMSITDPGHILGKLARSTDISEGFHDLTALKLTTAVNHMAYHFDDLLGKGPPNIFSPIAYIGIQDFRYLAMEIAAMKTFHPLLIPSTRNALANTVSLINLTGTKDLFYGGKGPIEEQAKALQKLVPGLKIHEVPTYDEMFSLKSAPHYPYTKTWEGAKNDQVLIVHTSGSTGNPKPIFYTNAWLRRCDTDPLIPLVEGRQSADLTLIRHKKFTFCQTPFFHLSGIGIAYTTLFYQTTMVMGPASSPPNGRIATDIAKNLPLSGILTVPSLCDAQFADHGDELKECLKHLDHILWFGGPLAKSTGDWITTHTKATLWQIYGSTEMAWIPMLVVPRSHWQYLEFHPEIGPTLERIHPDSDLYEIVIHRHSNPEYDFARPVFDLFPDHKEWRSRDLVKRCEDPGFENLWSYQGRVDDIIILHNGLKVNPVHIETKLQVHPALSGYLVFGSGYMQCGLLLQPKNNDLSKEGLLEFVWPAVEEANATVPEHARIDKRFVVVGTADRPFERASKGTIIRKLTVGLYEKEIEEVYGGPPKVHT